MKSSKGQNKKTLKENKKDTASALKAKTEFVNNLGASAEFSDVD